MDHLADAAAALDDFDRSVRRRSPAETGLSFVDIPAGRAQLADLEREEHEEQPQHGAAEIADTPTRDLAGLVIPAKDLYPVAGMPTSLGAARRRTLAHTTEPEITRIMARGALVPAKTAASELGLTAYCEPVGLPAPRNPRLPGCTPGGSSGGAAVAVANGLVKVAHGSDGGGSLRVPAASCGVIGFKPAHDPSQGLSTQGFITANLELTARLHRLHPPRPAGPMMSRVRPGRPVRIGLLTDPLFGRQAADRRWVAGAHTAADRLKEAGCRVVEVAVPRNSGFIFEVFRILLLTGAANDRGPASGIVTHLRERGRSLAPGALDWAINRRAQLLGALRRWWRIDALLTPALAWDPPPIGHFSRRAPAEDFDAQTDWTPWGSLFNLTATPAIAVPVDQARPLPASVQLGSLTLDAATLMTLANIVADPTVGLDQSTCDGKSSGH